MGNVPPWMVGVFAMKAGKVNFVPREYAKITISETTTVFISAAVMSNTQNCKSNNLNFVLFRELEVRQF